MFDSLCKKFNLDKKKTSQWMKLGILGLAFVHSLYLYTVTFAYANDLSRRFRESDLPIEAHAVDFSGTGIPAVDNAISAVTDGALPVDQNGNGGQSNNETHGGGSGLSPSRGDNAGGDTGTSSSRGTDGSKTASASGSNGSNSTVNPNAVGPIRESDYESGVTPYLSSNSGSGTSPTRASAGDSGESSQTYSDSGSSGSSSSSSSSSSSGDSSSLTYTRPQQPQIQGPQRTSTSSSGSSSSSSGSSGSGVSSSSGGNTSSQSRDPGSSSSSSSGSFSSGSQSQQQSQQQQSQSQQQSQQQQQQSSGGNGGNNQSSGGSDNGSGSGSSSSSRQNLPANTVGYSVSIDESVYTSNGPRPRVTEHEDGSKDVYFETVDSSDEEAMENGSMILWWPDWYCTHWWTDQGVEIRLLQNGDIVHVSGKTVKITGSVDVDRNMYAEDIREMIGEDKVLFQTCYYGGSGSMLIKYGVYV